MIEVVFLQVEVYLVEIMPVDVWGWSRIRIGSSDFCSFFQSFMSLKKSAFGTEKSICSNNKNFPVDGWFAVAITNCYYGYIFEPMKNFKGFFLVLEKD